MSNKNEKTFNNCSTKSLKAYKKFLDTNIKLLEDLAEGKITSQEVIKLSKEQKDKSTEIIEKEQIRERKKKLKKLLGKK